jgi:hypothetical protein
MALDTYANLQTAIATWLGRASDTNVTGSIPDMITLFESHAKKVLFTGRSEVTTTLTTTAGTATVALPSDFEELRSIKVSSSNPIVKLTYYTPEEMDATWVSTSSQTGPEIGYTIEGTNLRFAPTPTSADTITIGYIQGIPALSNSNTTNWLLTNHPEAYLFGALTEAEAFVGDDDRFPLWMQRRDQALERIAEADRKARWGGGSLQIKTDTGNP